VKVYTTLLVAVLLVLLSGVSLIVSSANTIGPVFHSTTLVDQQIPAADSCAYSCPGGAIGQMNLSKHLTVMVTLEFRNQTKLDSLLAELQDPFSPEYHKYLTSGQFISEFSPTQYEYGSYLAFFRSQGFTITMTYADRVSFSISGPASLFESVFHTNILYYHEPGKTFFAPDIAPSIGVNFGRVLAISGLSNRYTPELSPLFEGSGSSQDFYGSDFQAAYQLNDLYRQYGYPTNETIATILWAGSAKNGTPVAPFDPSDISTYFSNNLPAGEPKPSVYAYPVCGAPAPGPSSAKDVTGANFESTLDLEMAGSTAPGASIVEVYAARPCTSELNAAFAAILSPDYNTTVNNTLSKVVAISNSWGTADCNDTTWMQYEMEASARGITVLASSGDNGNTPSATPSFPASMSYNDFGSLAVGGACTELSGTASGNGSGTTGIVTQSVWFNTPHAGNGSQGGVSKVFGEPDWQSTSPDANAVITGASGVSGVLSGRGTPDIAGDGANMLIFLSTSGNTGYYGVDGTSIASPLVAGEISVIDHSIGKPLGFVNPLLYRLGQEQYSGTLSSNPVFYFISNGSNSKFSAHNGYSLVEGWGTINSYNFVSEVLAHRVVFNETGLPSGNWYVNISGVSESAAAGSNIVYSLLNGSHVFTVSSGNNSYCAYPANGTIVVKGNQSVNVTFTHSRFPVEFNETGLPDHTQWSVETYNISGPVGNHSTFNSSMQFAMRNGTYSYRISVSNRDYKTSNGTGEFNVSGSSIDRHIQFSPVLYTENFSETGIPGGGWYLILKNSSGGILNLSTNGSVIAVKLMNGTYTYSAGTANRSYYNNSVGTVIFSGGSPSIIEILFLRYVSTVEFNETGLAPGTTWSITLGNHTLSSRNATIIFEVSNGTVNFTVSAVTGFNSIPANGSIVVRGSTVTKTIIFVSSRPSPTGQYITSILSSRFVQVFLTLLMLSIISAAVIVTRRRR